ncbi:MAG: bifunctional metallophosphatase/5'-nucleotidase [Lachnospiraceae bacterium]|nr:bifunctional metallophosphatase/5'-nucleotidase [Lachnospiraceae bacterium]
MPSSLTHIVLLHSNDIHGDFAPADRDGIRTGGIARLSGFVHDVRGREEQVIYVIAGDMFMGSVIDREYKGLSTVKLVNALEPDVFSAGNHEADYGLSHLLFLEKCADFPIVCANIYIKELNRRVFLPYRDVVRGGVKLRFIGLLTQTVAEHFRQEELVDDAVSIRDVREEIGKVLAETAEDPADVTILMTHIGIEEDKQLAESGLPGVDFIIGGHSHTRMEEPLVIGGIPIVQAGCGSGQIGRFDLYVDKESRRPDHYTWQLCPVDETVCGEDPLVAFYYDRFVAETDRKYDRTLVTWPQTYTHPGFHRETELGDLFADLYAEIFGSDVFFLTTNVIWAREMGPVVTKRDLMVSFPYENAVYELEMTGERLTAMLHHIYRREAWEGANIFFLFSGTLSVEVRSGDREIREILYRGEPVDPAAHLRVGITGYVFRNITPFLGIGQEEIGDTVTVRKLADNDRDAMERHFETHRTAAPVRFGRLTCTD